MLERDEHGRFSMVCRAADDKENARLIVSQIVLDTLDELKMSYPHTTEVRRKELLAIRKGLKKWKGSPLSLTGYSGD